MNWSDIPRNPSQKTLRQFAAIWLLVFLGLGAIRWRAGHTTAAAVLGILALIIGLPGLNYPSWVRPVFVGWLVLGFPIGWAISQLLLGVLYYAVFMPLGLAFRFLGRDSLRRKRLPTEQSYWNEKSTPPNASSYFRQY